MTQRVKALRELARAIQKQKLEKVSIIRISIFIPVGCSKIDTVLFRLTT